MFWELALGLGFFGLMISLIILVVFGKMFYSAGFQSEDEDLAFAGILIGSILLIGSFLLTIISVFFVMRSSKKKWEAENPKTDNLK
jgi:uncharacterized membrane protein (DUF485 family)